MNALEGAAVNAAVGATTAAAPATTVEAPAVLVPAADPAPSSEAVVAAASPGSALAQQVRIPFFLPRALLSPAGSLLLM